MLHRLAIDHLEQGAQALVALHGLTEGANECVHIQRAGDSHRFGDIVEGAIGLKLVQEPEALLGEREGEAVVARALLGLDGGRSQPCGSALLDLDKFSLGGDGGAFKDNAQGDIDIKSLLHARNELRGQQGMPAQFEEVIQDADLLDAQHLSPDARQDILDRRAGIDEFGLGDA